MGETPGWCFPAPGLLAWLPGCYLRSRLHIRSHSTCVSLGILVEMEAISYDQAIPEDDPFTIKSYMRVFDAGEATGQ